MAAVNRPAPTMVAIAGIRGLEFTGGQGLRRQLTRSCHIRGILGKGPPPVHGSAARFDRSLD